MFLPYFAALATTGVGLLWTGPAGVADFFYKEWVAANNTLAFHRNSLAEALFTAGALTTAPGIIEVYGTFVPSANGTLQLQFRSEVAASAVTLKRGGFGLVFT